MKIGVLGSGKGSNFQAIIDAVEKKRLRNVEISVVISDVENAYILKRAEEKRIKAVYIDASPFRTKLDGEAEEKYIDCLKESAVDLVVLAGFMRMIKKRFLEAYRGRIINIHPALLPAFPGLESWKQALEYGVKFAGCTVHFVDGGMDTGPIIVQAVVPVEQNDTPESLHARIQAEEHRLFPHAIGLIEKGSVKTRERRTFIS